jgi:hypothetical protein
VVFGCAHTKTIVQSLPLLDVGSEHFVYFEQARADVIKVTKTGIFGEYYYLVNGLVNQGNCTPGEYLIRMRLIFKQFGFAPKPLGITEVGQFVSRQKFIQGDPPTQEAVDKFLEDAGLTPVKRNCWLWKGQADDGMEPWIGMHAPTTLLVARGESFQSISECGTCH